MDAKPVDDGLFKPRSLGEFGIHMELKDIA